MTYKLLIVDDEKANLRLLERLFSRDYQCLTASSGEEAIQLLEQHDVAILITDQRMPGLTGIDLCKHTAQLRPHMARILLTGYTDVEALTEAINCGLVDMYVAKPWNNDELKQKVSRALDQYENNKKRHALKVANDRLQGRIREMKLGFANALAELTRSEDGYLYEHAFRVSQYVVEIAAAMEVGEEDREELALAASLHDIGRVAEPIAAMREAAPLTEAEVAAHQAHSERLTRILSMIPELKNASDIIRFYRENFDGTGYPRGLAGEQIPLPCRILRIADEYDLMARPKTPAAAMSHDQVLDLLKSRSAKEFDPELVEAIERLLRDELATSRRAVWECQAGVRDDSAPLFS